MIPKITPLKLPKIIDATRRLSLIGNTQTTENNLFCLSIDDDYIHQLFPLLEDKRIKKLDYFGEKYAGAHISVIYPEENILLSSADLNKEHEFKIRGAFAAEIGLKKYYALMVDACV